MRMLLVDDDAEVAEYVRRELQDERHAVSVCHDGAAAMKVATSDPFDIVILDVMIPFIDGFEVTRRLRRAGVHTPILLLTARDAPEDVVRGLEAGADDYLTKPFSFDVLLARIRARTRGHVERAQRVRYGNLTLDFSTGEAWRGPDPIALTRTEMSILECLGRASGRALSRDSLIAQVWSAREVTYSTLEVFIRFLRAKIDVGREPSLIQDADGIGYRLRMVEA